MSKMGRAFRSCELITEESRLLSPAVRSSLESALTWTLVAKRAMGRTMCNRLERPVAAEEAAAEAAPMTTGVRTVSKPGSETTSV